MNIHVARNGQQLGQYSLEEVNQHLASGRLTAADLAWHDGLTDWRPLSAIEGVAIPHPSSPPPPPPLPVTGPSPSAPEQVAAGKGVITAGYICAALAFVILPVGFGIAALVLGIIALTKGRIGHGIAIIVLAVTLGLLGLIIGVAAALQ